MNGSFVCHVAFYISAGFCLLIIPISAFDYTTTTNGVVLTLTAIKNVIDYFRTNYQGMTLDTVFGLRVIEGQCKLLVEEYDKRELEFSSKDVMKSIGELGTEAGKVANMAIPHILEHDREYFGLLKQLIAGPWKVFRSHRIVNPALRWTVPLYPPVFAEIESNYCLNELMGEVKQNHQNSCNLTEGCLRKMFAPGQTDHYLQRQIFYTIVASKMHCESQINDYLVARTHYKNLDQVQHEYCTNAYYELEEDVASHGLSEEYKDVFLETEFLCPSLGYFQFIKPRWLEAIISWQSNDGCFPKAASLLQSTDVPPENRKILFRPKSNYISSLTKLQHPVLGRDLGENEISQNQQNQDQIKAYHDGNVFSNAHLVSSITGHPLFLGNERQEDALKLRNPVKDQYVARVVPHYDVEQREFHGQNIQEHAESPPDHDVKHGDISQSVAQYKFSRGLKSVDFRGTLGRHEYMSTLRQHLKEKVLPGGCLAYLTAMASASLALYLRYLVDPGPPEFRHLQLEDSFYQYTVLHSKAVHPPGVYSIGGLGKNGHLQAKIEEHPQKVEKTYESHHPVEEISSELHIASSPPPSHHSHGAPNIKDMMSHTWNFMGSYQRQWGPRFQPIYAGTNLHDDGLPATTVIHKAEVQKDLPDWTVLYLQSKTNTTTKTSTVGTNFKNGLSGQVSLESKSDVSDVGQFTAVAWKRYKDVLNRVRTDRPGFNVTLPTIDDSAESSKNGALQVHIIEIHSPLQHDLDHYLIAVVFISLVCLLVLFQYFRQRRKYVKGKTRVY